MKPFFVKEWSNGHILGFRNHPGAGMPPEWNRNGFLTFVESISVCRFAFFHWFFSILFTGRWAQVLHLILEWYFLSPENQKWFLLFMKLTLRTGLRERRSVALHFTVWCQASSWPSHTESSRYCILNFYEPSSSREPENDQKNERNANFFFPS